MRILSSSQLAIAMKPSKYLALFSLLGITLFLLCKWNWNALCWRKADTSAIPVPKSSLAGPEDPTASIGGEKLPLEVVKGIKKFVFFVGNIRSGSSILGSLMDAHPHVVIANEWRFPDFTTLESDSLKGNLFNTLYSACLAKKRIEKSGKGYTLEVKGMWQADYDRYIDVIGDKTAGSEIPYLTDTAKFDENFKVLLRSLKIPILAIQPIRNPFDMIATRAVIEQSSVKRSEGVAKFVSLKQAFNISNDATQTMSRAKNDSLQFYKPEAINNMTDETFRYFRAAEEVAEKVIGKKNVLQVHNCDLVHDPKGTILKVFNFLEVNVTEHYLDVCARKVFGSESRSRNTVAWSLEQIERIQMKMKKYEALNRYSFDSC